MMGAMPSDDEARVQRLREKIAQFPKTPGVYLMKDRDGVVLYIGKARDLRSRVASYFQDSAELLRTRGPRIVSMVAQVEDIDFLECESEVDALLKESRLIKDIQPHYNEQLKDDKTFPYLEIRTGDDFPGVYVTRRPRPKGSKLYGPFLNPAGLRDAVNALQRVFKFRTCELEIRADDDKRRFFRPVCCTRSTVAPPRARTVSPGRHMRRTSADCGNSWTRSAAPCCDNCAGRWNNWRLSGGTRRRRSSATGWWRSSRFR